MKTARKIPKHIFGLSRNQIWRLEEALHGSRPDRHGVSYLADQGFGMRVARAWYQTFQSLRDRGLVVMAERADGSLMQAYRITPEGRQVVEQILRSYPELAKKGTHT